MTFFSSQGFWQRSIMVVMVALVSLVVVGCGGNDDASAKIPEAPSFDEKTEAAVVETIEEHYKRLKDDPTRENLFEYGMVLQAHRRSDQAVKVYESCLEIEEDFDCLYLCGRILKRTDPERAKEFLKKALKRKGDYAPALLDLAEVEELSGDSKEAVRLAREAIQLEDSPLAQFTLGRNLLALGNADDAIAPLERAYAAQSRHSGLMNLLIRVYTQKGMTAKADSVKENLTAATDQETTMPASNPIVRRVLFKGRSYQSLLTKVLGALKARRYDKALEWVEKRMAINDKEAINFAYRAEAYLGMKKYAMAVKDFEKAFELKSDDALILIKLSRALVLAGRVQDGKKAIIKARRMAPKDPEARYIYALHIWKERPDAALHDLEVAVRIDPSYIDARMLLAKVLFVKGNGKAGREQIAEILKRMPGYPRALNLAREYKDLP